LPVNTLDRRASLAMTVLRVGMASKPDAALGAVIAVQVH
jgi:hypothetical protein